MTAIGQVTGICSARNRQFPLYCHLSKTTLSALALHWCQLSWDKDYQNLKNSQQLLGSSLCFSFKTFLSHFKSLNKKCLHISYTWRVTTWENYEKSISRRCTQSIAYQSDRDATAWSLENARIVIRNHFANKIELRLPSHPVVFHINPEII